nr:beta-D-glucosyl crocetin beta-1,6-glucosyltransferase-like [Ipomoea batatas]
MCAAEQNLRVMMFPWLGYGHISPFLELAKKLSLRNFTIFICSTPATLNPIRKKLGDEFSGAVKFTELHLPFSDDLPSDLHTTNGLPPHLMPALKEAFDAACPSFVKLLEDLRPDLLIYDFLQPWAPRAAADLDIPAVEFISSSSSMTAYMIHRFKRPGVDFPFSDVRFRDYELKRFAKMAAETPPEREQKDKNRVRECFARSCGLVLIKSFEEIEGKYSSYITSLTGKNVVPVGPLVQEPCSEDENSEILGFLNGKEAKSTVFVSFGSEYFLSDEDTCEIANGLAVSNVNFVWVLRFPKGQDREIDSVLPENFSGKVGERGLVVKGWAPQAKILQHPSIGGFVSHCGWSSVMEAMKYGVPIIAVPMHIDQPVNARLAQEVGVAVEVARDGEGKLRREKITAVINAVVTEEDGEGVRSTAAAMREMLAEKGDKEIITVVEELRKLCSKKTHDFAPVF